ncbi:similarity to PUTATIVE LIPASE [Encephalitozoon cuniculi GB-M1]|uniref:triacylglycerol lipase n=2 Tax=Encephalitozoon cuniculi TaxID=6035 RepID=Q8SVV1_ENCCU|nr:triglyceride lipase ATG15 [Encephalitozoon cuniculi GB-M1]AGE95264.1 putative lipase [Encephalitozoon cuniculi]KMV66268.1 putative lipase [Encephalitozoon cuniculi EcunIII-L]UYI27443.1 lipase [Encephalitozoon cuniculi]CAD25253.1 similarity to PUTATIVE LIPASE [Encephalitozoon cuniculi GB-M1]
MLRYLLQTPIYGTYGRVQGASYLFGSVLEDSPRLSTAQSQEYTLSFLDRVHLLEFIEMASNTYHSHDLDTVLATFGYDGDGLRAKVFGYDGKIVVAFKGTTLSIMGLEIGRTSRKDKLLDRILYSICKDKECEEEKIREFDSIGYFSDALEILGAIRRIYHEGRLVLTGHSLGGTIASLLGIRYNLPVVAFSSPGDAYAANILGLYDQGKCYDNIIHIGMCSDVVFRGECTKLYSPCGILGYNIETRCHTGRSLCIRDGGWDSLVYHLLGMMRAKIMMSKEIVLIERKEDINCIY